MPLNWLRIKTLFLTAENTETAELKKVLFSACSAASELSWKGKFQTLTSIASQNYPTHTSKSKAKKKPFRKGRALRQDMSLIG
jgi:hypothetical protein